MDEAYEELALAAIQRGAPAVHLLDRISREHIRDSPLLRRVIDAVFAGELQPDVLEWLWQRHEIMLTISAVLDAKLQVLDWMLTKKPDIFSWERFDFWDWFSKPWTEANAAVYSWFAARVDVQDLALHGIKNASHYLSRNSISFLLSLGPRPALERAMFYTVIERRCRAILSPFASRPQLVREICTENGGLLLRRLESWKKKRRNEFVGLRKFVRRFLNRSDYASVGLARSFMN